MSLSTSETEIDAEILAAFRNVPYPPDGLIVPPRMLGTVPSEASGIDDYLRYRHWNTITLAKLKHEYRGDSSAILGFLTLQAFHFFFPAFLRISLWEYEQADLCALSSFTTLKEVTRPDIELQILHSERLAMFSCRQLDVTSAAFKIIQIREQEYDDTTMQSAIHAVDKFRRQQNC